MTGSTWLLLVTNLPGRNQTLRMRVWRGLKATGAASLRDGVYVLPNSAAAHTSFEQQAREIQAGGGSAHVLPFDGESARQTEELHKLFDRTKEYAKALARLAALKRELRKLNETDARRHMAVFRRDCATLMATDFFPDKSCAQLQSALADAEAALTARFSRDEPRAVQANITRRDRSDYRGRVWATRQKLWIDRVCSAWLIRRFIDPKAKFLWLKNVKDCPKRALGFDFDGAEFTHVDTKVTFEVLLDSFGLAEDAGLAHLGALVHYLDVGGIPAPEASGFAAIMTGARTIHTDDTALLNAITPVINCLYAAYSQTSDSGK
jgi:hypothetical protein